MENFFSAVLGELATRSLSFFISKCSKLQEHDVEDHLHRALVRAQVILDEAMGRQVTNQAMLRQLDLRRGTMHRGCYMLDTLSRNTQILKELQKVLDNLSSMILDMEDVVIFFSSYRCLYRQPYSMHVLLGNCMFGRQMEAELAIKFLLCTQPQSYEELEVLPIVGPNKVGKSTLVAHVCKDERVYGHFSEILLLHDHDFTDDELAFREGCAMKHQTHVSSSNNDKRLLVVVELAGDLNDDAWNRLYSAYKACLPRGSKIIVTSRSDKVVRFGTAQALTLKHLPAEAYWYFFKTITFGSMDPETHPRFLQLAMEISRMQDGSLNGANIISSLLRDNFDIHFWCKIATFLRWFIQKNLSKFGETPFNLVYQNRPVEFERMATSSEIFLVSHQYECSSQEEIPKIRMQDVMFGSVKPTGKFDILLWRAQIPPYYSYVYTCSTIEELKTTGAKRKRSMKNGVTSR